MKDEGGERESKIGRKRISEGRTVSRELMLEHSSSERCFVPRVCVDSMLCPHTPDTLAAVASARTEELLLR